MDFKILLEKITPALKAISRRHVLYGTYDSEDLYQEMCLFLWSRFNEGLPIGMNEAYITKACEFHILNFLRKGRKRVAIRSLDELISAEGDTLGDLLADNREYIGTTTEVDLTIDDIKTKNLTDKEKAVLELLLKGCTVREAAEKLDISHVMVLKYKKSIIKKCHKGGLS
ncbi:MAG: sigma-70 family RNA polymerase sigma factor [Candidatus Omnitrophica bacterium]|nr:sigma-70 family RNA polymerase sigma factor [Candidatus Omnitrophota bacterium]